MAPAMMSDGISMRPGMPPTLRQQPANREYHPPGAQESDHHFKRLIDASPRFRFECAIQKVNLLHDGRSIPSE
jgi:hypothetical protein